MTFPFSINAFFDKEEEFLNFEYGEIDDIAIEELIEQEMEELNLVDLIMLPYENRSGSASPPHIQTPDCTPSSPTDHGDLADIEEEDGEDIDLATFTDLCLNAVLRPIPTYSPALQTSKVLEPSDAQRQ
jgi:hypothetical protein